MQDLIEKEISRISFHLTQMVGVVGEDLAVCDWGSSGYVEERARAVLSCQLWAEDIPVLSSIGGVACNVQVQHLLSSSLLTFIMFHLYVKYYQYIGYRILQKTAVKPTHVC